MRKVFNVFAALVLWISCAGPAWALPALSTSRPTLDAPRSAPSTRLLRELGFGLTVVVGVAITVKDSASSAQKFVSRASGAAQDYSNGVKNAGQKWATNAKAGEQNWKTGTQDAATRGAFGKGIDKAGPAKFQDNAVKLGTQRYPDGVSNAQNAYQHGVDPYLNVLKSIDIGPRGPKGSQANMNRANQVAVALRKAKVGG